jgi:hypothetical protein
LNQAKALAGARDGLADGAGFRDDSGLRPAQYP